MDVIPTKEGSEAKNKSWTAINEKSMRSYFIKSRLC
jgi:hypothetical protein